jgi:hypothetical protein
MITIVELIFNIDENDELSFSDTSRIHTDGVMTLSQRQAIISDVRNYAIANVPLSLVQEVMTGLNTGIIAFSHSSTYENDGVNETYIGNIISICYWDVQWMQANLR